MRMVDSIPKYHRIESYKHRMKRHTFYVFVYGNHVSVCVCMYVYVCMCLCVCVWCVHVWCVCVSVCIDRQREIYSLAVSSILYRYINTHT